MKRQNLVRKTCPNCKRIDQYLAYPSNYACPSCDGEIKTKISNKWICVLCSQIIVNKHIREFHYSVELVE